MAGKKMSTEITIPNDNFSVKVGTLNKLNPETVYIELGTFITPRKEEETYDDTIYGLERDFKSILRDEIAKDDNLAPNHICIFDIAKNRVKTGKKSFLFIQCCLRQKQPNKITKENQNFSEFTKKITSRFENQLSQEDFDFSKTKKEKTIYKEIE